MFINFGTSSRGDRKRCERQQQRQQHHEQAERKELPGADNARLRAAA
jgi:hypothetical protein